MFWNQPSATRPFFERISISADSSKLTSTNSGWNFGINVRNGDSFKKGGELPTAGEYSIWATFIWKVLRKCVPKCSFGHPKSSFGSIEFARWFTKDSRIRCAWDAMIFCNKFVRWYKRCAGPIDNMIFCNMFARLWHCSRRQLVPILDKPSFSRISQAFQPQFVVPNFREFVKRQVCSKWD